MTGTSTANRPLNRDQVLISVERLHGLLAGSPAVGRQPDGATQAQTEAEHLPPTILDVRWELPTSRDPFNGKPLYLAGHIPGAVYIDLDTELADPPSPQLGRHPLPSDERLQHALERCGVTYGNLVVVYDAIGGLGAARAWWLLRDAGFDVRLLDGGLPAWQACGYPLATDDVTPLPSLLHLVRGQMPTIEIDDIPEFVQTGILFDARGGIRYRGEVEPLDPRPGHIPGADSAPVGHDLDKQGYFISDADLQARFVRHGVTFDGQPSPPIAVYCGSGITASHEVAALAILGVEAALFPGSYSQWSSDPTREVETGHPTPRGA